MVSRYSVIQYVPNPIAGERINIGILAFDDDKVQVQFVSHWDRVRCLGQREDVSILKDFARQMQQATQSGLLFPGDQPNPTPKHERLLAVTNGWVNSIQFTEPRGSLESVDCLISAMARTYLQETEHHPKPRDRQLAARLTATHVRSVLRQKLGQEAVKELLRINYELPGHYKNHKFDVTVANGKPFFAAHGISFEVQTSEALMDSLSWMIADVKESMPEFPLAVIALPPRAEVPDHKRLMELYESTTDTYQNLGANVLNEAEVDVWVSRQVDQMDLAPHPA